jgi:hypothetical protein
MTVKEGVMRVSMSMRIDNSNGRKIVIVDLNVRIGADKEIRVPEG